jgi:hypothetical protein
MDNLEKAILEDLKTAIAAFKDDSFENVNIFANRIMSNSLFGTNNKLFLPGFFLKEVAFTFGSLKAKKTGLAFSTAKAYGFSFVESLSKNLDTLDEKELWTNFRDYEDKIRKYDISEWESKNYTDNIGFTEETFKWLLSYLKSNEQILLEPPNFLLKGIINEMNRVTKVHSASVKEIVILSVIISIDRNYDYINRYYFRQGARVIDEPKTKQVILPAIDNVINLYEKEFSLQNADSLLWDLVKT